MPKMSALENYAGKTDTNTNLHDVTVEPVAVIRAKGYNLTLWRVANLEELYLK